MWNERNEVSLVLASASPRRAEMLERLGVNYRSFPREVDESVREGEDPEGYVARVCRAKTESAVAALGADGADGDDGWSAVLAADTTVVVDRRILGKPLDRAEARGMLEAMSGRDHHVVSGYRVVRRDGACKHGVVRTRVRFRSLRPVEIEGYLDLDRWQDKAGGYGIQEAAAFMVEEVEGSFTNVVGLPLEAVIGALVELGQMKSVGEEQ